MCHLHAKGGKGQRSANLCFAGPGWNRDAADLRGLPVPFTCSARGRLAVTKNMPSTAQRARVFPSHIYCSCNNSQVTKAQLAFLVHGL